MVEIPTLPPDVYPKPVPIYTPCCGERTRTTSAYSVATGWWTERRGAVGPAGSKSADSRSSGLLVSSFSAPPPRWRPSAPPCHRRRADGDRAERWGATAGEEQKKRRQGAQSFGCPRFCCLRGRRLPASPSTSLWRPSRRTSSSSSLRNKEYKLELVSDTRLEEALEFRPWGVRSAAWEVAPSLGKIRMVRPPHLGLLVQVVYYQELEIMYKSYL